MIEKLTPSELERIYCYSIVEKIIYPTDDRWMRYDIEGVELQEGTLNIGVQLNTPPVLGRIKDFRLWKVE